MRTHLVNTAAGVIGRAMLQNRTATGVALALESAQLLQDPETAKEHADLKARVAELEAQRDKLIRWHDEDAAENARIAQLYLKSQTENTELRGRVAELEGELAATKVCQSRALRFGSRCSLRPGHSGNHMSVDRAHYWSDDYATPDTAAGTRCALHGSSCDGDMEQAHIMQPAPKAGDE